MEATNGLCELERLLLWREPSRMLSSTTDGVEMVDYGAEYVTSHPYTNFSTDLRQPLLTTHTLLDMLLSPESTQQH